MKALPLNPLINQYRSVPITSSERLIALFKHHAEKPLALEQSEERNLLANGVHGYFYSLLEDALVRRHANLIVRSLTGDRGDAEDFIRSPSNHPEVVARLKRMRVILTMSADALGEDHCHYVGDVPQLAVGIFHKLAESQIDLLERRYQQEITEGTKFEDMGDEWYDFEAAEIVRGWWSLVMCFIYNVDPSVLHKDSKKLLDSEFERKYCWAMTVTSTIGDPLMRPGMPGFTPPSPDKAREVWMLANVEFFDNQGTGLRMEFDQNPPYRLPAFNDWAGYLPE